MYQQLKQGCRTTLYILNSFGSTLYYIIILQTLQKVFVAEKSHAIYFRRKTFNENCSSHSIRKTISL